MVKLLQTLNPADKKILVRTEFDVPIEKGVVTDTSRIEDAVPTIKYLLSHWAKVILISHAGRPEGVDKALSLKPVIAPLEKLIGIKVNFIDAVLGREVEKAVTSLKRGEVLLLENLRFEKGEATKDETFAKTLSSYGDYYVNEAFGVSHRDHASLSLLPTLLPSYPGLRLNQEFENLSKAVSDIDRPFIFIFGGKKADTKLKLLPQIASKVDQVLLGGTMFLQDFGKIENVVVPVDVVLGKQAGTIWEQKVVDYPTVVPDGWEIYDIGPRTIKDFGNIIREAKTVGWNGPVGWYEQKEFEEGTKEIAQHLAIADAFTIVGGGDTDAALKQFKLSEKMGFVSSGGGAMLEFIAGNQLPGLKALGYYS